MSSTPRPRSSSSARRWWEVDDVFGRAEPPRPVDEDFIARRLLRLTEWNEDYKVALARAGETLHSWLNAAQRSEMDRWRRFTVTAPSGRRYQIYYGRSMNVYEVDERNRPLRRLCAHPSEQMPDEHTMLAQKWALEMDEDGFLATANVVRQWRYRDAA